MRLCPTPVPYEQWDMWDLRRDAARHRLGDPQRIHSGGSTPRRCDYVIRESVALKVKLVRLAAQVGVAVAIDGRVLGGGTSRPAGQITIAPEWWDLLTPARPRPPGGAFSVSFRSEPDIGPRRGELGARTRRSASCGDAESR